MSSYLVLLTICKLLVSIIGIGLFAANIIQYFNGKREKLRNAVVALFGCFFLILLIAMIEKLLFNSAQKVYSNNTGSIINHPKGSLLMKPRYFKFNFITSHHQFYISDKAFEGNTGSRSFWTKEAFQDRLAIESGILGVGTECYGPVKAELYILNKKNDATNFDQYDHVVEGSLEVKSQEIEVLNCPTSSVELKINVVPGTYRVRVYSSNLKSVDGDEGEDSYKIEIWPDIHINRRVLKRYNRL